MAESKAELVNSLLGKMPVLNIQPDITQTEQSESASVFALPLHLSAMPLIKDIVLADHDPAYTTNFSLDYKGDSKTMHGAVSHNYRVFAVNNIEPSFTHYYDVKLLQKDGKYTLAKTEFFSFDKGHFDDYGVPENGMTTEIHKRDPKKMGYAEIKDITAEQLAAKVEQRELQKEKAIEVSAPLAGSPQKSTGISAP